MADSAMASTPPEPQPKKRKLRYPRTGQACVFCRRRKVRCSGTYPCEVCVREDAVCQYAGGLPSSCPVPAIDTIQTPAASSSNNVNPRLTNELVEAVGPSHPASSSRRSSIDPPQTFGNNHVGPTSGVSFLYGQWDKGTSSESKTGNQGDDHVDTNIPHAPLVSWGDLPQLDHATLSALPKPIFTTEQILDILDRYFQYVSPTYRFLHHQTVKKWATVLVSHGKLPPAQEACVLLVCAQTLLHSPATPGQQDLVGHGDPKLSLACSERAKVLLDKESGPPSLASVQSRIASCLYLLSTFRLNECRYCFSFAVTIATTLGIHRRQLSSSRINTLEAESRKRTFWSMYCFDGYLSVMLGRPRLLRDEDIDQTFPNNIADADLISSEPTEDLPLHGDLEAFVSHAKLAQLMARGNDQLYPLHHLSNEQLLSRSNEMVDALLRWQNDLPKFLQARKKTFTGQRTFERQNTILKLAWAHARILATRRCLLINFSHAETSFSQFQDTQAKASIQECISAIIMVLETTETLIENGQCYGSFWTTQYIALVAISTLYVLIVQGSRHALPRHIKTLFNVEEWFEKAKNCHDHLATLPPPGSQAQRHHVLLSRLRSKAERSLAKMASKSTPVAAQQPNQTSMTMTSSHPYPQRVNDESEYVADQDGLKDMSVFGTMLTPGSSSENSFEYMLDFGWESLDTIGAFMRSSEGISGLDV